MTKKGKNKVADYSYLAKVTIQEFITTDDKKYFHKNFKWNLINFWTQLQISKSFSTFLKGNNIGSSNTVFYSYWFHKSAILLSILKDKGIISSFTSRAHSIDLYHNFWGIINDEVKVPPFKMFKLKHVTKLYCVSNHGATFLKEYYPKYAHKVAVSYLGVNEFSYDNIIEIKESGIFNIVTCSGINSNKRVNLLAEALIKIKSSRVVKWIHFGWGADKDINELKVITNKFPSNISTEIRGHTPNEDILRFYKEHEVDLFVNLSIVEGLPVAIMEAMQYGIPVLATKVYGTPEIVFDHLNGFLLDVNFKVEELAKKIDWFIEHKEASHEMRSAAKQIYFDKFNAKKNYTEFAEYLINH